MHEARIVWCDVADPTGTTTDFDLVVPGVDFILTKRVMLYKCAF